MKERNQTTISFLNRIETGSSSLQIFYAWLERWLVYLIRVLYIFYGENLYSRSKSYEDSFFIN